jgi:hypothetical protein
MHVIVPLWMMAWSKTLVYSCECVVFCFVLFCFTVLSCEHIFLCALCCLMFIDMFHIQMQLMQRLDQWNEYICMYVTSSHINFLNGSPNTRSFFYYSLYCVHIFLKCCPCCRMLLCGLEYPSHLNVLLVYIAYLPVQSELQWTWHNSQS